MAVKQVAFNLFSALLAVATVLMNWLSWAFLHLLGPLAKSSAVARNLISRWGWVTRGDKATGSGLLQTIGCLVLGGVWSAALLHYHVFLVETVVTVTYQLHLLSLNWAWDLPDYSAYLKDSEAARLITEVLYLLFGLLGLSTQVALTIDFISIFSYPFKIFHKLCTKASQRLQQLKEVLINILTIKRKYWVTCPYPEYLLCEPFKVIYVCALPLIFYLILITRLYSLFMAFHIKVFDIIAHLGANLAHFLEELPRLAVTLLKNESKSLSERFKVASDQLKKIKWESMLGKQKQFFLAENVTVEMLHIQEKIDLLRIQEVYEKFSDMLQ